MFPNLQFLSDEFSIFRTPFCTSPIIRPLFEHERAYVIKD